MNNNIEILKTEDGSTTLFRKDLNEHYHSTHGAITESLHVFIKMGLEQCSKPNIKVLEIGFGTGLNALLTAIWAEKNNRNIDYHGYELYPLGKEIIEQLDYPQMTGHCSATDLFAIIHGSHWETKAAISNNMSLIKLNKDVLTAEFNNTFDVIYFDAFAPNKQEEMWNQALFDKIAESMKPNAVFTTYCAKGSVKRMLQGAGLTIKKVPGPPGKREMLTARKL